MSNPLKPGDACWICGCVKHPVNVGKSCELVEQILPGAVFTNPLDSGDRLRMTAPYPVWLVVGDSLVNSAGEPGWTLVKREHLRRLDDPAPEVSLPERLAVAA